MLSQHQHPDTRPLGVGRVGGGREQGLQVTGECVMPHLRGSKNKGHNDDWNPAIAKIKDSEPRDGLHDEDVGQEEEEEQVVGLEQVHLLSGLPQGPEVLSDLQVLAVVLAGLLRGQITDQQRLHELAHETEVAVEGEEGVRSTFPCVVPDDPKAPWMPAGPLGDVDFVVDDEPPVRAQVVLLNLLPAEVQCSPN